MNIETRFNIGDTVYYPFKDIEDKDIQGKSKVTILEGTVQKINVWVTPKKGETPKTAIFYNLGYFNDGKKTYYSEDEVGSTEEEVKLKLPNLK